MRLGILFFALSLSLFMVVMFSGCGGGTTSTSGTHFETDNTIGKLDMSNPLDRWAYNPDQVGSRTLSYIPSAPHSVTYTLFAGQTIDVGEVTVWAAGGILYVKYLVDVDPYWLQSVAFNIGTGTPVSDDFIPGHMPYSDDLETPAPPFTGGSWHSTEYTFAINMADAGLVCGGTYWFITHADIGKYYLKSDGTYGITWNTGMAGDHNSRTEKITKKWGAYFHWTIECPKKLDMPGGLFTYAGYHPGTYSYWKFRFNSTWAIGDDPITPPIPTDPLGEWLGWCVATGITMYGETGYPVYIYDTRPADFFWIERPDHQLREWDKINWLINEKRVDMGAGSAIGPFDEIGGTSQPQYNGSLIRSAFQLAVWCFVKEDTRANLPYNYTSGITDQPAAGLLAQKLVDAANANGEGYLPYSGDYFAVLVLDAYPTDVGGYKVPRFQPNIMEVDP